MSRPCHCEGDSAWQSPKDGYWTLLRRFSPRNDTLLPVAVAAGVDTSLGIAAIDEVRRDLVECHSSLNSWRGDWSAVAGERKIPIFGFSS
jgi:hypothetical protein